MQILRLLPVLLAACLQAACDAPGTGNPAAGSPVQAARPASAPQAAGVKSPDAAALPAAAPASGALPADVAAFRSEREQCDHFRGEEGYDERRRQELAQQLERFCKGTDARLAALRSKYAAQPNVIATLKDFEDQVE
jgi:hypothetical protein